MILFVTPETQGGLSEKAITTLRAVTRAEAESLIKALKTCIEAGMPDMYSDTFFFDGDSRHRAARHLGDLGCDSVTGLVAWLLADHQDGVHFYKGKSLVYGEG